MPLSDRAPLADRGRRRCKGRVWKGGFRTVELNVVGWSAIGGTALVLAGLAWLGGIPVLLAAVIGLGVAWTGALLLDYRAWRRSWVGFSTDLDSTAVESLVAKLSARGIEARYHEFIAEPSDGKSFTVRTIECRAPAAPAVERELRPSGR